MTLTRKTDRAAAFWAFSLDTYARRGVDGACIELQDEFGFDVNLMLLCAWLAQSESRALPPESLARLIEATAMWNNGVVAPLRSIRRMLNTPQRLGATLAGAEACRDAVKAAELSAECVAQQQLIDALPGVPMTARSSLHEAVRTSLAAYAQVLQRPDAEPYLNRLVELMAASPD